MLPVIPVSLVGPGPNPPHYTRKYGRVHHNATYKKGPDLQEREKVDKAMTGSRRGVAEIAALTAKFVAIRASGG